ncbi:MAG: hypothetical protein ABIF85_01705 [Nanoarchaeota archaeon]|nr:hypothetical protein [Nanoarchaeota archaeon]MBU4299613.1 hypothetical protein [Nanoarchaeota archaeon]MBU4451925.1 hypothetical protein [Nanoarchaeota archaeon]MCG2723930.1 hypothetical protein [archaeon]
MKTLELLKKLEEYPVFDIATIRNLTQNNSEYAKLCLHRLKIKGYIFELQRNKYTVHKDPFILASNIVWPSYISLWSAIRHYNLTEQLPRDIWVITTRNISRKEILFNNTRILFIRTRPKYFFGYRKTQISGFEAFIAEPEKALLDGILFKKISFSEIAYIIKHNRKILRMNLLADFAIESSNQPAIKRLGYLLDALGFDYYNKFKKHLSGSFVPLEYAIPAKGKRNEKWRVLENTVIL